MNQADQIYFEKLGYQTQIIPLTTIKILSFTEKIKSQIASADWLFFTSQAAVQAVLEWADKKVKIAVIGKKTAEVVKSSGFEVSYVSPIETKVAFIRDWQNKYPQAGAIFYPKSQLADDYLETALKKKYQVTSFVAYQNCVLAKNQAELRQALARQSFQGVYLTSPSAWRRFYQVYRDFLAVPLTVIVIGETTKKIISQEKLSQLTVFLKGDFEKNFQGKD